MKKMKRLHIVWVSLATGVILLFSAGISTGQTEDVTFSRDIAPILQQRCQDCHRPGQMGPMSLVTYEEVRPWAPLIKTKVVTRTMPPWHLDKTVGIQEFENDVSLTNAEIDKIVRWGDAGAPRGNLEDMPAAMDWPQDELWRMAERYGREPDLIIKSTPWSFSLFIRRANSPIVIPWR